MNIEIEPVASRGRPRIANGTQPRSIGRLTPHGRDGGSVVGEVEASVRLEAHRFISRNVPRVGGFMNLFGIYARERSSNYQYILKIF